MIQVRNCENFEISRDLGHEHDENSSDCRLNQQSQKRSLKMSVTKNIQEFTTNSKRMIQTRSCETVEISKDLSLTTPEKETLPYSVSTLPIITNGT